MNLPNWRSQLRRGLLEFVVMELLSHGRQHGYEMVQTLKRIDGLNIREGNIYPILARLEIDGMIKSKSAMSEDGPPRKYFELSRAGEQMLGKMEEHWNDICKSVDCIRKGKHL